MSWCGIIGMWCHISLCNYYFYVCCLVVIQYIISWWLLWVSYYALWIDLRSPNCLLLRFWCVVIFRLLKCTWIDFSFRGLEYVLSFLIFPSLHAPHNSVIALFVLLCTGIVSLISFIGWIVLLLRSSINPQTKPILFVLLF